MRWFLSANHFKKGAILTVLALVIVAAVLCAGLVAAVAIGAVLVRRSRQTSVPYAERTQRRDGYRLPGGGVVGGP